MKKTFIETPTFSKQWASIGLSDEDLREMQNFILSHLDAKNIISGTEGIRKIRWDAVGRGKRGGSRTIYIDIISTKEIFFLYCYPKNKQVNITQKKSIS